MNWLLSAVDALSMETVASCQYLGAEDYAI